MQGHKNLINLRQRGLRPAGHVSLCDYPVFDYLLRWDYEGDGKFPTISTAGDPLETLDLRFLVGLQVHISGDDQERVRLIAQKARKAGAETVVCVAGDKGAIWRNGETKWQNF